jgi:hypothetical protein
MSEFHYRQFAWLSLLLFLGGVERIEVRYFFKRGEKVRYGVMVDFSMLTPVGVGIFYKIARVIYYQNWKFYVDHVVL